MYRTMNKHKKYISGIMLAAVFAGSCTKLDERVYDKVDAGSFLTRREDVIRDFLRPFEHGFWSIQGNDVYAVVMHPLIITAVLQVALTVVSTHFIRTVFTYSVHVISLYTPETVFKWP